MLRNAYTQMRGMLRKMFCRVSETPLDVAPSDERPIRKRIRVLRSRHPLVVSACQPIDTEMTGDEMSEAMVNYRRWTRLGIWLESRETA